MRLPSTTIGGRLPNMKRSDRKMAWRGLRSSWRACTCRATTSPLPNRCSPVRSSCARAWATAPASPTWCSTTGRCTNARAIWIAPSSECARGCASSWRFAKDDRSTSPTSASLDYTTSGRSTPRRWTRPPAPRMRRSTPARTKYWSAQLAAGRAWLGLGDAARAREAFHRAIDSVERLRGQVAGGEEDRQRAFELRVDPYHEMVALLAGAGDARGALDYAERAKGRVLVDVLRNGRVNITNAMTDKEKAEERGLNDAVLGAADAVRRERQRASPDARRIADAERQAADDQSRLDAFRRALYASHPELKARRSETGPVTTPDLSALIPDTRTAVVEYVVTRRATFAFVVTKGTEVEVSLHRIDRTSTDIDQEVNKFREALGRRDLAFGGQARALGALLLEPLKTRLAGRERLVIVPDGPLWELPFQALSMSDGRFLIQHYTLSSAPSLTALHAQRLAAEHMTRQARAVVAFGDPRSDAAASPAARDRRLHCRPRRRKRAPWDGFMARTAGFSSAATQPKGASRARRGVRRFCIWRRTGFLITPIRWRRTSCSRHRAMRTWRRTDGCRHARSSPWISTASSPSCRAAIRLAAALVPAKASSASPGRSSSPACRRPSSASGASTRTARRRSSSSFTAIWQPPGRIYRQRRRGAAPQRTPPSRRRRIPASVLLGRLCRRWRRPSIVEPRRARIVLGRVGWVHWQIAQLPIGELNCATGQSANSIAHW